MGEERDARAAMTLEETIIEFYREEIRRRYLLEHVRQFPVFDPVPDETLDELRTFFIENIYPPVILRRKYDEAFEHLSAILHSPRRLKPLLKTAIRSAWRLGPRLPAAISAGLTTVDSLKKTRRLESLMMDAARDLELSPDDLEKRARMIQVITSVPEKAVYDLIRDVLSYFHSMTNIPMLEAMLEVMENCNRVMESYPDIYTEEERQGVVLGINLAHGGLHIFRDIDKKLFPVIIKGIETVEYDWFEEIKKEAAG